MKKTDSAQEQATCSSSSTRKRGTIFGKRRMIALRMTAELNERMMGHCDSVHVAANTYVNGLIESALAKTDPASKSLQCAVPRAAPKVTVTIRMEPALHERLNTCCNEAEVAVSVNAFVCGLVRKDLKQRGL